MVRMLVLAAFLSACKGKTPPAAVEPVPIEAGITKSPLDGRSYRLVELENGLRAVVVHDPDTDKAAAALSVHIGQLADPKRREGLAHFLEHMLFMGTDEFPDVDAYRKYIQENGGGTNAGTGSESTTYYFDVKHDHLMPAMDRFSRFFVAPKLDATYVERERNAVNAEYKLKIEDDIRRIREVKKKTRNPNHPYSQFSVGNLDTLGDREGEDLHADLRELYKTHYVGDNMTFSVIGRESLDELEAMVRRELVDVPARTVEVDRTRPAPYRDDQLGVEIRIEPNQDIREIQLIFPVPSSDRYKDERPVDLLNRLIGDEGEGSLFAELKKRGWVESLRTGEDGADDYSQMETNIVLTAEGYEHRDDVVTLFFQMIEVLMDSDLSEHFEEEKQLGALAFQFAEEVPASRAVQSIVRRLPYVDAQHVLEMPYRYVRFDERILQEEYLGAIVPENMRLVVIAKDVETDQVEPLYQTPYAIEPIAAERMADFVHGGLEATLHVPELNPYIAQHTAMKEGAAQDMPTKLDVEGLDAWHMLDTSFGVPRSSTSLTLVNPAVKDVASRSRNRLYAQLLDDALEAWRYPLARAGLYVSVSNSTRGLSLDVSGYDEKQAKVLEEAVQRILAFEVDPERFELEKDELVRALENRAKARPISQLFRATRDLLNPDTDDTDAELAVLRTLTADDLSAFAEGYWKDVAGRMLVHGNTTASEAEAMAASVAPLVGGEGLGVSRSHRLAEGELTVDVPIDHGDSTIGIVYEKPGVPTEADEALFQMLAALLRTDFFTELRTNQQLGYVVFAGQFSRDRLPGMVFAIQSAVVGPEELEKRIDAFIAERPDALAELSPEVFEAVREGVVNEVMKAETRLSERTGRLSTELFFGETTFDSRERSVEALRAVTQDDVVAFARTLFADDPHRLVVRSTGTSHEAGTTGDCEYPSCPTVDSLPLFERER